LKISPVAMRVCLARKRILITRSTIKLLGNPTHLCCWYEDSNGILTFLPAAQDDIDAFEIPQHFWKGTKQSCEIARIAFLVALQEQIGWEDGSRYAYNGILGDKGGIPIAIFELSDGIRLK